LKKKKELRKSFWLRLDLFDFDILVIIGPMLYASGVCKRKFGEDFLDPEFVGQVIGLGGGRVEFFLLHVSGEPFSIRWYAVLAHEVSHLVDRLIHAHSIPPDYESSTEVRALATDNLMEKILDKLQGTKFITPQQLWEEKPVKRKPGGSRKQ